MKTDMLGNSKELMNKVSITAVKGSLGHTFGAAGAIEGIFCMMSVFSNKIPVILNLEEYSDMPRLNFVRNDVLD